MKILLYVKINYFDITEMANYEDFNGRSGENAMYEM